MKALRHEAPAAVGAARRGCRRRPASASRRSAVVFASAYRKHVGKTLLLRALEPLAAGRPARRPRRRDSSPRPTRATASHLDEVPEGMIVSAVKADHLAAGRLATAAELHATPDWHRPQPAILHRILAPTAERDSVKLSGALASLAEGDGGAQSSARIRPPAARWSARRARSTCGSCASG